MVEVVVVVFTVKPSAIINTIIKSSNIVALFQTIKTGTFYGSSLPERDNQY